MPTDLLLPLQAAILLISAVKVWRHNRPSMRSNTVLVRGANDIGSVVAHRLFQAGLKVILHDDLAPAHLRRGMAFTDAYFSGSAELEGVAARLAVSVDELVNLAKRRAAACGYSSDARNVRRKGCSRSLSDAEGDGQDRPFKEELRPFDALIL